MKKNLLLTVILLLSAFPVLKAQTFSENGMIYPTDGAVDDRFGNAVSISGDFLFCAANLDDDDGLESGSVYVWKFDGTNWNFFEKLTAGATNGGDTNDKFGNSISVSGTHAVIGAWADEAGGSYRGSAYIYEYNGTTWGSPTKIAGQADYDSYGSSVAISGDYMIIGAIYKATKGAAYIYHYQTGSWVLQDIVTPSNGAAYEEFGFSVGITDSFAIVGSHLHNSNAGGAYIYARNGTSWNANETFINPVANKLGTSVAISGNRVVIGSAEGGSKVFVYEYNTGVWAQIKQFTSSSLQFGEAVSISGDKILVGDWGNNSMTGAATLYINTSGTTWTTQNLAKTGIAADDRFGNAVCISGYNAIVGAHYDDPMGAQSGSAIIYSTPPPPAPIITAQPQNADVCLDGNITFSIVSATAISFQWYDTNGTLVDNSSISGATTNQLTLSTVQQQQAGNYYCIATNIGGSTQSNPASLTVSTPIVANAGTNQTTCVATAILGASQTGTGLWSILSGSATIENPTLYSTTVSNLGFGLTIFSWALTNGACITEDFVSVTYNGVVANAGPNQVSCDGTVSLNATLPAGNGFWSINNGSGTFTDISSATAQVSNLGTSNTFQWNINNAGCTSQDQVTINYEQVISDFTAYPASSTWNANSPINISNNSSTNGISYLWTFQGENPFNETTYVPFFTHQFATWGQYTITLKVTGPLNCNSTSSQTITLLNPTGVNAMTFEKLRIYPNPAKTEFTVENINISKLKVFDITGKTVFSNTFNNINNVIVPVKNLSPGLYFIEIYNKKNVVRRKIILE